PDYRRLDEGAAQRRPALHERPHRGQWRRRSSRTDRQAVSGVAGGGARGQLSARAIVAFCALCLACGSAEITDGGETLYVATLSGAREIPPANTPATGSAAFTRRGSSVSYSVTATGFATPLTVGHIHIG